MSSSELSASRPPEQRGASEDGPLALAVEGLSKAYGSTQALDGASLAVRSETVHGLVGNNGSGKSTLIKILAGVVAADAGVIVAGGERYEASLQSPARARSVGLHFVHQQTSTFPDLTVAENLAIGRGYETGRLGRIRWRQQRKRARELIERFEIPVSPDTLVGDVGAATQMMVAIARALQDQDDARSGVLVLDEPTASLPRHEVGLLLDALRRYAAAGRSIIYVSHRLDEIMEVSDEVTALRDGQTVATLARSELSQDVLIEAIMGRALARLTAAEAASHHVAGDEGVPVLELRVPGDPRPTLVLHAGECVGVAGLLGSGRSALLRQIFGAVPRPDLEVSVEGKVLPQHDPRAAMNSGVAYVPEDRPADAMFPDETITENLSITTLRTYRGAFGRIDGRAERSRARELIGSFSIRAESEQAVIGALSGGNQQKVVLARWMQRDPKVLLLDEPTQGVDVGARADIRRFIRRATAAGAAVLVVSSEFEELVAVSDRAVIVNRGQITDEVPAADLDEDVLKSRVYSLEITR